MFFARVWQYKVADWTPNLYWTFFFFILLFHFVLLQLGLVLLLHVADPQQLQHIKGHHKPVWFIVFS